MVNRERMALRAGRTIGLKNPERIGYLGRTALVVAATATFSVLYLGWTISGSPAQATEYTLLGLAGTIGVCTFANYWTQTTLAGHVDILNLALNATSDAQLILAGDGR